MGESLIGYLMGYTEGESNFITFDNGEDAKNNYFLFCIIPSVGCTIRRGRLGLSFDCSPGKINIDYFETETNGNKICGTMKVPLNTI